MKKLQAKKIGNAVAVKSPAPKEIRFYRSNERPYGVLSNLFARQIVFEGIEYPTSEHAYQAGKPRKESVRKWLLAAPSPALLAMAAHGLYSWDIAPDWSTGVWYPAEFDTAMLEMAIDRSPTTRTLRRYRF